MSALFYLAIIAGICLALPIFEAASFPIYKLFGGELTFVEYMEGL